MDDEIYVAHRLPPLPSESFGSAPCSPDPSFCPWRCADTGFGTCQQQALFGASPGTGASQPVEELFKRSSDRIPSLAAQLGHRSITSGMLYFQTLDEFQGPLTSQCKMPVGCESTPACRHIEAVSARRENPSHVPDRCCRYGLDPFPKVDAPLPACAHWA